MDAEAAISHTVTTDASEFQYLTDYSVRDKPWDVHRLQADSVQQIYQRAAEFERLSARVGSCAGLLRFGWTDDQETGETALRLREAQFCRVRYCPVCQWRRSLMWQAKFHQSLPQIQQTFPKSRWIFLTLTVRNCGVTELGDTLTVMNQGWQRLKDRKEFRPVQGWVRTTEVTRGSDGSAHPHFHALMMVPPSMLSGKNYIKKSRWIELWRDCARLGYEPNIDVRVVKGDLSKAVSETLKYSTKPADMVADEGWFLDLTRQTHKRRFVATGGALKDVLKSETEITDADLIGEDGNAEQDDGSRLAFNWQTEKQRYCRYSKRDVS